MTSPGPSPCAPVPGQEWRAGLALAALGIVFGDLGTSPLYTLQECLSGRHGATPDRGNVLGILSLIFWAITLVVTFKSMIVLMRVDNQGEGGIMALLALAPREQRDPLPAGQHAQVHGRRLPALPGGNRLPGGDGQLAHGHHPPARAGDGPKPGPGGFPGRAAGAPPESDAPAPTYLLWDQTLLEGSEGCMGWLASRLFAFLARNAHKRALHYRLPPAQMLGLESYLDL